MIRGLRQDGRCFSVAQLQYDTLEGASILASRPVKTDALSPGYCVVGQLALAVAANSVVPTNTTSTAAKLVVFVSLGQPI